MKSLMRSSIKQTKQIMDLIDKLEKNSKFMKYLLIFATIYLITVFILDYYLSH